MTVAPGAIELVGDGARKVSVKVAQNIRRLCSAPPINRLIVVADCGYLCRAASGKSNESLLAFTNVLVLVNNDLLIAAAHVGCCIRILLHDDDWVVNEVGEKRTFLARLSISYWLYQGTNQS